MRSVSHDLINMRQLVDDMFDYSLMLLHFGYRHNFDLLHI